MAKVASEIRDPILPLRLRVYDLSEKLTRAGTDEQAAGMALLLELQKTLDSSQPVLFKQQRVQQVSRVVHELCYPNSPRPGR